MELESESRIRIYVKVNHLKTAVEEPACKIAEALRVHRHRMVSEVSGLYLKGLVLDTEWCNNPVKLPIADSIIENT